MQQERKRKQLEKAREKRKKRAQAVKDANNAASNETADHMPEEHCLAPAKERTRSESDITAAAVPEATCDPISAEERPEADRDNGPERELVVRVVALRRPGRKQARQIQPQRQIRVKANKESKYTPPMSGDQDERRTLWVFEQQFAFTGRFVAEEDRFVQFSVFGESKHAALSHVRVPLPTELHEEQESWVQLIDDNRKGKVAQLRVSMRLADLEVEGGAAAPCTKGRSTNIGGGDETSTPWSIKSLVFEKMNQELAMGIVVPPVNNDGATQGPNDINDAQMQQFMLYQFAVDLVNHRQSNCMIDEIAGTVENMPLAGRNDGDLNIGVGILMLAGDGQLRKGTENFHPDLLPTLGLENLAPEAIFKQREYDTLKHRNLDATSFCSPVPPSTNADMPPQQQRLEYLPHVLDRVNQWFARGVAGAVCRSAERGRGIVLVDAGVESELVSRLSHSLSMWRLPTLRVLGVVQNTKSQQRTRSLVDSEDVRGKGKGKLGFVRERLQGMEVVAAEEMRPCLCGHLETTHANSKKSKCTCRSDKSLQWGSKLDVNHSHFVVCAKPPRPELSSQQPASASSATSAAETTAMALDHHTSLCLNSPIVDVAERLVSTFQATKAQMLRVRQATRSYRQLGKDPSSVDGADGKDGHNHDEGGKENHAHSSSAASSSPSSCFSRLFHRLYCGVRTSSAGELAVAKPAAAVPRVCLIVNGGERAKVDALNATRHHWDLVVLKGTGGLADTIAVHHEVMRRQHQIRAEKLGGFHKFEAQGREGVYSEYTELLMKEIEEDERLPQKIAPKFDPVIDEIVSYAKMTILDIEKDSVEDVARLLTTRLNRIGQSKNQSDHILEHAWKQYAAFSRTADEERKWTRWLNLAIIALSMTSVFFAILKLQLQMDGIELSDKDAKIIIAIAPIALVIITAVRNRFYKAVRWMQLFVMAEKVHRETYEYRTRTGPYMHSNKSAAMARRLAASERLLLGSDVTLAHACHVELQQRYGTEWLSRPAVRRSVLKLKTQDDVMLPLDMGNYVVHRLAERLAYFRKEAEQMHWRLHVLSWGSYLIMGGSTLLVFYGQGHWASVTINLQNLVSTYISTEGYEKRMIRANNTAVALAQITDWWDALGETDQMRPANRQRLVRSTENVVSAHTNGWVASMKPPNQQEEDEEGEKLSELETRSRRRRKEQMNSQARRRRRSSILNQKKLAENMEKKGTARGLQRMDSEQAMLSSRGLGMDTLAQQQYAQVQQVQE
jgi:hypothetical protein